MYPLLAKDGLVLSCWALAGIFYLISSYLLPIMKQPLLSKLLVRHFIGFIVYSLSYLSYLCLSLQCASSFIGLLVLCTASHVITPPSHLPDLFPVLISGYSCILFLLFWLPSHNCTINKEVNWINKLCTNTWKMINIASSVVIIIYDFIVFVKLIIWYSTYVWI